MTENEKQLKETELVLMRLYQKGEITIEAFTILNDRNNQAINYTHCCKSDSEQLVLFADWLQYNGKWYLPEQQAKDFLKEQQEQN